MKEPLPSDRHLEVAARIVRRDLTADKYGPPVSRKDLDEMENRLVPWLKRKRRQARRSRLDPQ